MLTELDVDFVLVDRAGGADNGASAYSGGIVRLWSAGPPTICEFGELGFKIAPAIAQLAATEIRARLPEASRAHSKPTASLHPTRFGAVKPRLASAGIIQ